MHSSVILLVADFSSPCDYGFLQRALAALTDDYPFVRRYAVGRSLFGREIPLLQIGRGGKKILLVGAVHGSEHMTAGLLLRFAADYCSAVDADASVYSLSMGYLFEKRTLCLLPMLNPDGVELSLHGPADDCPLLERLMRMCPDGDFTHWQANGRGVDLNHNFDADFEKYKRLEAERGLCAGPTRYSGEYPESEPETAAVCAFLRAEPVEGLIAFHTQGEEIYYDRNGYVPTMGRAVGGALARMCSYRLARPEGGARYGGLKDWFIGAFDRPGFTVECGKGENPLPQTAFFSIYATLRKMLFHSVVLL